MSSLTKTDKKIIRRLQGDIPLSSTPYRDIAEELGIPEALLLERVKFFQDAGILKRLGAVIRHQNAGFTTNAMLVWRVSPQEIDRVGGLFAELPFVSHCYQREPFPEFPYTLYTMVHAKSMDEHTANAEAMSRLSGISDYEALFSLKEFKKSSLEFF